MSTEKAAGSSRTEGAEDKLLELARRRFKVCVEAEDKLRARQLEDKRFAAGDQWPEAIKKQRAEDNRPCLVIDRLKPQLKQVTNAQKAMRPAVQVNPVDNGADPETAEVLQGLIRHIENQSDADDAYDQAGKDQVEIGRGWFRITTEYCDDDTGNQEIRVERVRNPFSIYTDPSSQRRDTSDKKYAFEVSDLTKDELQARFPDAKYTTGADFEGLGDDAPHWMIDERIRVVKYWHVETTKTTKPGTTGKDRVYETHKVSCDVLTGLEVLEHYDWAGKYIPLVPVIAEEIDLEGEVDIRGMVRGAKDPQRMLNYWKSATTEAMALAPKAPIVAAEGQLEPYIAMWKQANTRNLPYLLYKPTTLGGALTPPPQRQVAEPPIQAMMAQTQAAENDLRAATGFFDVDERESREQSGRAIMARQQMGQHGNSDYLDGLSRGIRFGGRILIDLAPKIYDAPRVVRILGLDNQPQLVMIHAGQAPAVDPATGAPALPEGVKGIYDLSVGTYDVTVTQGPSMQSSRQEFVQQMGDIFAKQPQLFQILGDLFFENMDVPNAKQISERLKKMLPPQLQDKPQGPDPTQLQGQIQQMAQQMQEMAQQLQEAQSGIEAKKIEADSRERIAQAQIDHKERLATMEAEIAKVKAAAEVQIAGVKAQAENARFVAAEGRSAQETLLEHAHQNHAAERSALHALAQPQGDKAA